MKKAGSLRSKSKTRRTSKSTAAVTVKADKNKTENETGKKDKKTKTDKKVAASLAVGHRPAGALAAPDEELFRAFQSNLLSLISHELKTPLMGVLNALTALEEGVAESGGVSSAELLKMARQNAQRLQHSLLALLDLASLESGIFHARLKETDLFRLVQRSLDSYRALLVDSQIETEWKPSTATREVPVLADPQKLSRALDLCFQILSSRVEPKTQILVHLNSSGSSRTIQLVAQLKPGVEALLDQAWSQALVGFEGGLVSPYSAFAGVVQSEKAFLSRMEEGLGSEFLLIHELLRLHHGQFTLTRDGQKVELNLVLPELTSEEGLLTVLSSRAHSAVNELRSVALILLQIPKTLPLDTLCQQIRGKLFRTSDAVYPLRARHQLALVLDDCKLEDASQLMSRVHRSIQEEFPFGISHCPSDGFEPLVLLELAEKRLAHEIK